VTTKIYGPPPEDFSNRNSASACCLITQPEKGIVHITTDPEPAQVGRLMAVRVADGFEVLN